MAKPGDPYSFSLGGPLRRLEERLRITRGDDHDWVRRTAVILLIAYVPTLVFGTLWWLGTGQWPDLVTRVATHVRWLVAAPLLLLAEYLVERRAREATDYLLSAELIPPADTAAYLEALHSSARRRESLLVEGLLLAVAIGSALVQKWYPLAVPPPHWWSGVVALALFRFLLLRWAWRWWIWIRLVRDLSQLRLRLNVLHPDNLAGLEPLLGASYAFCAVIAAVAASAAGGFADLMDAQQVPLRTFYTPMAVYVAVAYLVAAAPMWWFARQLLDLRHGALHSYGAFAARYCDAFSRRWMRQPGSDALGTSDLQSLADLDSSFATAAALQSLPGSRRLAVAVLVASLAPMLPLVVRQVPLNELALALLKALA